MNIKIETQKKPEREYVLPAPAGLKVLYVNTEDKKLIVHDDVVGFLVQVYDSGSEEITTSGIVGPITSNLVWGFGDPRNYFGVLYPDGHVECDGMCFDTRGDAQNYINSSDFFNYEHE